MEVPIDLLRGANGSAAKPWPIYNIRQLQAIDGVGITPNGEAVENFPLFGLTERERSESPLPPDERH